MNTSGDAFLPMFDGPQRAITGECEVRGDDIGGIAVLHRGARERPRGAERLLASSTLRDLVIGSGLEFEDRGSYELKGAPGE